jgi:hypothetical protein
MEGLISSFCNIFDSVCGAMTRLVASGLVEGVEEVKKTQICIKIQKNTHYFVIKKFVIKFASKICDKICIKILCYYYCTNIPCLVGHTSSLLR